MTLKKNFQTMIVTGISVLGCVGMCVCSSRLASCTLNALRQCAVSVVPTLFPFIAVSSILTQTAPELFSEKVRRNRLFDLPGQSVIVLFLGVLCGFPVGVVSSVKMYQNGILTKKQATRLAAVSNHCSPAFVISVVGTLLHGSFAVGLRFYLIELSTSILLGSIFLILTADRSSRSNDVQTCMIRKDKPLSVIFTESISDASIAVLRICAFVVFFAVILDAIDILFPTLPEIARCLISCISEFTAGCTNAAKLGGKIGAAMTSFAIGFSGLSVMAQSASFAASAGIGMKNTFCFKLVQGIFAGFTAYLLI